jgi:MraZ protein
MTYTPHAFGRADRSRLGQWAWTVDAVLLTAVLTLIGAGVLFAFGNSPAAATRIPGIHDPLYFAWRQLGFALAGVALFEQYRKVMEELAFGDPLRSALETMVLGGMHRLAFDTAGRITLPEELCQELGLTDWVTVVGLGDRFQVWSRDAFRAHRAQQRQLAREGLAALRERQRQALLPNTSGGGS